MILAIRKWQGKRDSNPQPSVLETAVLPVGTIPLSIEVHYTEAFTKVKHKKPLPF